jgi:hypothetical protein
VLLAINVAALRAFDAAEFVPVELAVGERAIIHQAHALLPTLEARRLTSVELARPDALVDPLLLVGRALVNDPLVAIGKGGGRRRPGRARRRRRG